MWFFFFFLEKRWCMEVLLFHTHLGSVCLSTMSTLRTGPRWLWWRPTSSLTAVPKWSTAHLRLHTEWLLYTDLNSHKVRSDVHQTWQEDSVYSNYIVYWFVAFLVPNPCATNRGGCEHICVLSHQSDNGGLGYRCKCRMGYDLHADGKRCFGKRFISVFQPSKLKEM